MINSSVLAFGLLIVAGIVPANAFSWHEWNCVNPTGDVKVEFHTVKNLKDADEITYAIEISGVRDPVKQRVIFRDRGGVMSPYLNGKLCQKEPT